MITMDEVFLYQQIAESIRKEILAGRLKSGDRLPSMRELMKEWKCTPGTVQRAYQELSRQGLVISRAGQGTHVAGDLPQARMESQLPLRRAALVHRAEAFLLESLTVGYSLDEARQAIDFAMDRWRVLEQAKPVPSGLAIRFSGSHDMAINWLAAHLGEIIPGAALQVNFTGSLGGLIALAEDKAELAGCHLWDAESDTYNTQFVRKLFPGKKMILVTLAFRRLGLIIKPGNPLQVRDLRDLSRPDVCFINRQTGSGTRVWLDSQLNRLNIKGEKIRGFENEKMTHSEVAQAVAEGQADVGLGVESAAMAFGLDFLFLVRERYDLVSFAALADTQPLCLLFNWLATEKGRKAISGLKGYESTDTGKVELI